MQDAEPLLTPRARQALPLWRQAVLYLDPFPLFKDASGGGDRARAYNSAQRWILIAYVRRWMLIAAAAFGTLFIAPTAALAVSCCIAVTVATCIGAAYFLLGAPARL